MAQKDDIFGDFIDNLEKQPAPEKKGFFARLFSSTPKQTTTQATQNTSDGFYDESMAFIEEASDSRYETTARQDSFSGEEFVPTLRNLFGFKWWEFGIIVVEFLLILYMVLVLLKIVPLF